MFLFHEKKLYLSLWLVVFSDIARYSCWLQCCAALFPSRGLPARTSVAVVTDSLTYSHASEAIEEYVSSMRLDGKRGILLIDRWGVPDSLRAALMDLYKNESLEGAVLVGDIPVPMIRDAQHLSSALQDEPTT